MLLEDKKDKEAFWNLNVTPYKESWNLSQSLAGTSEQRGLNNQLGLPGILVLKTFKANVSMQFREATKISIMEVKC